MYDGWRRGIKGRGGQGVFGYLVKAALGEVGDLSCADKSGGAREFLALNDCDFLCLRRFSSLFNLIRIDRRAGPGSSSGCRDLDRACRFEAVELRRLPLLRVPISDSDSEDMPEDDDPED